MSQLNIRSLEILKHVVDMYVESGDPIGSATLSERLGHQLSSATIRNVMAHLEDLGLLYSPHTSAGRLPTDAGLRFFVDELLEIRDISQEDRHRIEETCKDQRISITTVLREASAILSDLSTCAGFVVVPQDEKILRHIEFISLGDRMVLGIMVTQDGDVEKFLLSTECSHSTLVAASNYLNARLCGHTLKEARRHIAREFEGHQTDLNSQTQEVVRSSLDVWSDLYKKTSLIVNGQSNLLNSIEHIEDLHAIKHIFSLLEKEENLIHLLDASMKGEGIQIFIGIGEENEVFHHVGCSVLVSNYEDGNGNIVGAVGVIGPRRLHYSRVASAVHYTAQTLSQMVRKR